MNETRMKGSSPADLDVKISVETAVENTAETVVDNIVDNTVDNVLDGAVNSTVETDVENGPKSVISTSVDNGAEAVVESAAAPMVRTPEEEFLASMLAGRDLSDLVDPEEEQRRREERIESLTPAEREAYCERQALATVFADIRERSRVGELTTAEYWELAGLTPDHMEPVEFTDLVFDTIIAAQNRDTQDAPEKTEASASIDDVVWHLDDIAVLEGAEVYLYSSAMMSDSFAHWAFLAAEDNDVVTLVDNARNESKLYPRPLKAASLKNRPVYMTDDRIDEAFRLVQESGQYPDIKKCAASNGDVYFYSTDYLSDAQAKALAEWESVERRANM